MRNILKDPIWEKAELGLPLPDSLHAVSFALPTWKDVIDYEEKEPRCINSLRTIYPRFGLNPLLKDICRKILKDNHLYKHNAWPYSDEYLAMKAKNYCDRKTSTKNSFLKKKEDLTFLITKNASGTR